MAVSFWPYKLKHNGKMVLLVQMCFNFYFVLILLEDNHFDVDMTLILPHFHLIYPQTVFMQSEWFVNNLFNNTTNNVELGIVACCYCQI